MTRLLIAALFGLALPAVAAASDFQTGWEAYVNRQYGAALAALTASAEAGDPRAAQLLADMYAKGYGVAPNQGAAFQWRQRAALLGDAGAQWIVAMAYLNGTGVPKDAREAALWMEQAARQNHPNAQLELGLLYLDGYGVAKNAAEGMAWIRRAADQGLFDAQQVLANVYETGQGGVPKDAAASSRWATLAKQNQQAGEQINQSIMQQQNAIAVARSAYYAAPAYGYPWVYPSWGVGWGRYSGWNYGAGIGGVWR